MYRLTIYDNADNKSVDEFRDEDALREQIDIAQDKIEKHAIKTYSVSWIVEKQTDRHWWDEEG
jgi:hypothetical protein